MTVICGSDLKTTYWEELTNAEGIGLFDVEETFRNAMDSWNDNACFAKELVLVLGHKKWFYYKYKPELAKLYQRLHIEARSQYFKKFKNTK